MDQTSEEAFDTIKRIHAHTLVYPAVQIASSFASISRFLKAIALTANFQPLGLST